MKRLRSLFCSAAIFFPCLAFADEPQWGHLSGRFLYGDAPPPVKKIQVPPALANRLGELHDESLVVHRENRGVANILVLLLPEDEDALRVHPAYAKTAGAEVKMHFRKGRVDPHIVLLRTTQTLLLIIQDDVSYNPKMDVFTNAAPGFLLPAGGRRVLKFQEAERLPAAVNCSIHPWINGRLCIQNHPYMTVTDDDGRFEIRNLPVGRHTFRLWHERAGYLKNAKFGSLSADHKGRLTVDIKEGQNAVGETVLDPKRFR